jgi:hypothetical protein
MSESWCSVTATSGMAEIGLPVRKNWLLEETVNTG